MRRRATNGRAQNFSDGTPPERLRSRDALIKDNTQRPEIGANLIDRFFRAPGPLRGHVVDFFSVGWWPVFNVADPAVVGGAILLVALSLFGFDFDTVGRRRLNDDADGKAAEDKAAEDKQADDSEPVSPSDESSAVGRQAETS